VKILVGSVIFAALFALGWFVFGIHPSFAEVLLIVLASAIADGVAEGVS
jgi:hypothetical protein